VVAQGSGSAADQLLGLLRAGPQDAPRGRPGAVRATVERWDPARDGLDGFRER